MLSLSVWLFLFNGRDSLIKRNFDPWKFLPEMTIYLQDSISLMVICLVLLPSLAVFLVKEGQYRISFHIFVASGPGILGGHLKTISCLTWYCGKNNSEEMFSG